VRVIENGISDVVFVVHYLDSLHPKKDNFLITLNHSIQKRKMGQALIQRPQLHGWINGE
jgi:hypothetical protein